MDSIKCPQCNMSKNKDVWEQMTGKPFTPNVIISCPACARILIYDGNNLRLIEISNPRCDRIASKLNEIDELLASIRAELGE